MHGTLNPLLRKLGHSTKIHNGQDFSQVGPIELYLFYILMFFILQLLITGILGSTDEKRII